MCFNDGMTTSETTATHKTCGCGCGLNVARRFRPGHDARLKGQLLTAARRGSEAAAWQMVELGWGHYVDSVVLHELPYRNNRRQVRLHLDSVERFLLDSEGTFHARANCRCLTACARRSGQIHPITKLARPSSFELVGATAETVARVRNSFDRCTECRVDEAALQLVERLFVGQKMATVELSETEVVETVSRFVEAVESLTDDELQQLAWEDLG